MTAMIRILIETAVLAVKQNIFMMFARSNWQTLIGVSFALSTVTIYRGLLATTQS
jgi:hypothetical protein